MQKDKNQQLSSNDSKISLYILENRNVLGYNRRKLTWHQMTKTWTRLFTFHTGLVPLGKVRVQLLFLQLWVNRANWALYCNQSERRKTDFKHVILLRNWLSWVGFVSFRCIAHQPL